MPDILLGIFHKLFLILITAYKKSVIIFISPMRKLRLIEAQGNGDLPKGTASKS